ncbi:MAG TPA: polysaccharide deacetylase family protein [Phycisphaerae bacterium]|nr:polysaccharide deacetylase family protein [Phycisphaerae bacterium]
MIGKLVVLVTFVALLGGCNGLALPASGSAGGQNEAGVADGQSEAESASAQKPRAFMQLIEFHDDIQGVRNWAYELEKRGLKSIVNVQKAIVEAHPEDIRWLADHGHEIMGLYDGGPLWDVPYEEQLQGMQEVKEVIERVTGKPMRTFSSAYAAWDENTLKAADEVGVEYVFARGASDVEALIYKPDGYNCQIISQSNVTFEDMGRGSLCDYSLYARGATGADFEQILDEALAKYPKRLLVTTHAYLGGMKKEWWEPYEELLDGGEVEWVADFDEWVKPENGVNIAVPFSMVPDNREVKYTTPTPAVPLDELEDVDEMYNPCAAP